MQSATPQPVLEDRLYIVQGINTLPPSSSFRWFEPHPSIQYDALCDDFGPVNMASVLKFARQLDTELAQYPASRHFYCVQEGQRALTNAVFLVGSYLILMLDWTSGSVSETFLWLEPEQYEEYRDATHSEPDFRLALIDCWRGLERGKTLGWVDRPSDEEYMWGQIDQDEYSHYDRPINGDLHEVVPGKFVAFKGPKDLGGKAYSDDERGYRSFSPSHYADIFNDLGVKLVVRLNEPEYNAEDFGQKGIQHLDLEFEDCTAPPADVVDQFMAAAEAAGSVAVHCKAGLGRTGTLIALYMMKHFDFSGREAMGWLRIMRPGSVIGEQQHFLCGMHHFSVEVSARSLSAPHAASLAAQVAAGMEQRDSSRNMFTSMA